MWNTKKYVQGGFQDFSSSGNIYIFGRFGRHGSKIMLACLTNNA